jgi:photosystem II stability/assembly factor-like uncharacterized protein
MLTNINFMITLFSESFTDKVSESHEFRSTSPVDPGRGFRGQIKTMFTGMSVRLVALLAFWTIVISTSEGLKAQYSSSEWRSFGPHAETGAIAVDPANPEILFAGVAGFNASTLGIYKSSDNGRTWSLFSRPTGNPQIWELEISPLDPEVILAGTYGAGVLRSLDGGQSWNSVLDAWLRSLEIAPSDPNTVYVLGDKLHISKDGGRTWVTKSLPWENGEWAKLDVHPQNEKVIYMYSSDYWNAAVLKSEDGGETIEPTPNQPDTSCGQIKIDSLAPYDVYCVSDYYPRIYKSKLGGEHWTFQSTPDTVSAFAIDPRNNKIFYIATYSNVYRSRDAGATWEDFGKGLAGVYVSEFEFDKSGRLIHAATQQGIYSREIPIDPTPAGDFDGDRRTDLSVWRPKEGRWYLNNSIGYTLTDWGLSGDRVVAGDYDGDGRSDCAVFRPSDNHWYRIHSRDGSIHVTEWGLQGDLTVPSDYDGDGKSDLAVWRPAEGRWYLNTGSAYHNFDWGLSGDKPVPADFDNNGRSDLGIFRDGDWYILDPFTGAIRVEEWGLPGDIPVPADYDGDGMADLAVFRPSEGRWYIRPSKDWHDYSVDWGIATDTPVPGDYDADGRADIAVFRTGNGFWYRLFSKDSSLSVLQWGLEGDRPAPAIQTE